MNATNETVQRLAEAKSNFSHVLTTAIRSKNAWDGCSTDRRGVIADTLLLRGILTGLSIHQLLNPQPINGLPVLVFPDFASIAVMARSIVETFLTMHSISLKVASPEEANLRLLWWDWHRVNERIRARNLIGSSHPELLQLDSEKTALEQEIRLHNLFQTIPADLAKPFKKGRAPIRPLFEKLPSIAAEAGIHPSHFDSQYQMLSGVAHSEPVVVSILEKHDPATTQILASLNVSLEHATAYLAFMVSGVGSLLQSDPASLDLRFRNILVLWKGVYSTPFNP